MKVKTTLAFAGIAALLMGAATDVRAKSFHISDLPLIGDVLAAGKLTRTGDAAAAAGKTQEALADYRAALAACPDYEDAEIGAAHCSTALGDYPAAITYYRESINGHHEEDDIDEISEFAEVLSLAGQGEEAISRYDHVVDLCKKGDCISTMDILPPKFDPDGSDYDAAELQAMTHLMRAMNSSVSDYDGIEAEIQKADALDPDSPLVPFYQGILLDREGRAGAKAAFQQALALDDGTNAKAINKWIAQAKS